MSEENMSVEEIVADVPVVDEPKTESAEEKKTQCYISRTQSGNEVVI